VCVTSLASGGVVSCSGGARPPGGAVHVDSIKIRVETSSSARLWFQRLKLQSDELRSSFAFHFNLRPYNPAAHMMLASCYKRGRGVEQDYEQGVESGRNRLSPVSARPETLKKTLCDWSRA